MKHTQAPWKHDTLWHLYDKDEYSTVSAGIGYYDPKNNKGFNITGCMSDADAKLIAAAPELYDVIKKCQDILATWIVPDSGISYKKCLNELLSILDNSNLVSLLNNIDV